MKNTVRVFEILQAVSNQNIERPELNQLIELTQSFAYTNLKFRYRKLAKVLMVEDLTLNEMAIDAIAPLFEINTDGILIRIKSAFDKWEPAITNEEAALFFLSRIASKSTEKYVSELLRSSDPFFSKILRSVNYIIERGGYRKKQILGVTYIVKEEGVDIGRLPDNQCIYDLPSYLFKDNKNILNHIFEYMKENTGKAEAIPLNALVLKIKNTGMAVFDQPVSAALNGLEIESIVNRALKAVFKKLETSYADTKKIDEKEELAIKRALSKIAADLKDGGINPGLQKYLMKEIDSLTFEDYRTNYQNILEYLFKMLKKEIIEHLDDE